MAGKKFAEVHNPQMIKGCINEIYRYQGEKSVVTKPPEVTLKPLLTKVILLIKFKYLLNDVTTLKHLVVSLEIYSYVLPPA